MKEVCAAGTLGISGTTACEDRHQLTKPGKRRPRGALVSSRGDLVRKSIPLAQIPSDPRLCRFGGGMDDESNSPIIPDQALAPSESPERKASNPIQHGLRVGQLIAHQRNGYDVTYAPYWRNLSRIEPRIHKRRQSPPRCDPLRPTATMMGPVALVARIAT